ncbi:MAG: hypothetical protein KA717_12125 [Woronichinia naegeliana WA131]|uniref:Uncharacterized protein n=1 Tax=Woronichinia naegeliana WA131 TaxID=2824559 RepID=A0A977PYH2_9CYAN|nr:MAG: hypothetical protein KA717_12125 [Woronichinia naegeliana WA131]
MIAFLTSNLGKKAIAVPMSNLEKMAIAVLREMFYHWRSPNGITIRNKRRSHS